MYRARPSRSEKSREAWRRSGLMLEAAMWRTLPSFTSSSRAVMISSTGTVSSSKCV
ncbi:hypothetical protein SMICM17S_07081 [Streptomyces microflavus]